MGDPSAQLAVSTLDKYQCVSCPPGLAVFYQLTDSSLSMVDLLMSAILENLKCYNGAVESYRVVYATEDPSPGAAVQAWTTKHGCLESSLN